MKQERAAAPAAISCPSCRRTVVTDATRRPASFPFCSERCRIVDLGSWAEERYSVPAQDIDPEAEG